MFPKLIVCLFQLEFTPQKKKKKKIDMGLFLSYRLCVGYWVNFSESNAIYSNTYVYYYYYVLTTNATKVIHHNCHMVQCQVLYNTK